MLKLHTPLLAADFASLSIPYYKLESNLSALIFFPFLPLYLTPHLVPIITHYYCLHVACALLSIVLTIAVFTLLATVYSGVTALDRLNCLPFVTSVVNAASLNVVNPQIWSIPSASLLHYTVLTFTYFLANHNRSLPANSHAFFLLALVILISVNLNIPCNVKCIL